jgi:hypothetical protein
LIPFLNSRCAVQLSWDVVEFTTFIGAQPTGFNDAFEARVRERYPPYKENNAHFLAQLGIIHDASGKILCWNLPAVLKVNRQVGLQP